MGELEELDGVVELLVGQVVDPRAVGEQQLVVGGLVVVERGGLVDQGVVDGDAAEIVGGVEGLGDLGLGERLVGDLGDPGRVALKSYLN